MTDAMSERERRLEIGRERHQTKRRTLLAETRLVSEWVALNYPGRDWHFQFRVGASPRSVGLVIEDEAEERLARNLNRRVDAVVAPPPDIIMIEGKMWDATTAIGRLQEYQLLLPATPEVARWGPAPVVPVLLTAQDDPVARIICQRSGIRYVFWEPPWIDDFYAVYPERRRKAAHPGMLNELIRRAGESTPETPLR